jgi:hypothetical protein
MINKADHVRRSAQDWFVQRTMHGVHELFARHFGMHWRISRTGSKEQGVDHHVVDGRIKSRTRIQSLPITCGKLSLAGWEVLHNGRRLGLGPDILFHFVHDAGSFKVTVHAIGSLWTAATAASSSFFSLLLDVSRNLRVVSCWMHRVAVGVMHPRHDMMIIGKYGRVRNYLCLLCLVASSRGCTGKRIQVQCNGSREPGRCTLCACGGNDRMPGLLCV